ncbi:amidase family protein [Halovenus amylolytica]|uniref:amidase family protein n=1 Tax=Halovenus amylolytica TaxID=2500550 RepID=UPI003610A7A4
MANDNPLAEKLGVSSKNIDQKSTEDSNSITRRSLMKVAGAAGAASFLSGQVPAAASEHESDGFDPIEATIQDVYSAIFLGEVTAVEVAELYLERIEHYNEVLNAVITINENALDRAEELDHELEESGPVGPLHGVPILVKDIYNTGDIPTTAGSLSLEGSQPEEDSYYVAQLREAGAVVLGKSNTHEYARGGTTVSSLGGQTYNPYDIERIPSGSSGGTAAATAANLAVFGTASDTGGSTRGPATFNNLVGLRPTVGLVSLDGIVPIAGTYDTPGINTRTVAETALILDITAGYDPNNPTTSRGVGNIPTPDSSHPEDSYVDCLSEDGLSDARIGVYRDFFGTEFDALDDETDIDEEFETGAAQVTAIVEDAIAEMESLGATIVDPVSIGPIEEIYDLFQNGYYVQGEVKTSLNAYFESLGDDAPIGSVEELFESGLYACDIADSIEAANDADLDTFEENFRENVGIRTDLRNRIIGTMAEDDLDAILFPSYAQPPPKVGESSIGYRARLSSNADMPAISVPAGFTEDDHLPVGVELLARQFDEPLLLQLAHAFEQGTDHRVPPEGFGQLPGDPPEPPEEMPIPIAAENDC